MHACFKSMITHRAGSFSGYSCDIWAAGICLWVFIYGSLPFNEESPDDLFDAIIEKEPVFPQTKVILCILACVSISSFTMNTMYDMPPSS